MIPTLHLPTQAGPGASIMHHLLVPALLTLYIQ
jgi:hypothetical protein